MNGHVVPRNTGGDLVREKNPYIVIQRSKMEYAVLSARLADRSGRLLCAFKTVVPALSPGRDGRLLLCLAPSVGRGPRGPPAALVFPQSKKAVADAVKKFLIGRALFAVSAYLESEGHAKVLSALAQESVLVSDCHGTVASRRSWISQKIQESGEPI